MDELIYVTSMGSMDLYPKNDPCEFTNNLPYPLTLDANTSYEMGLVSLLLPKKFHLIIKNDSECGITFTVTFKKKQKKTPKPYAVTHYPLRDIIAGNMNDIIRCLNDDIGFDLRTRARQYQIWKILPPEGIFQWDGSNVHINSQSIMKSEDEAPWANIGRISISFNNRISRILGFESGLEYTILQMGVEYSPPPK